MLLDNISVLTIWWWFKKYAVVNVWIIRVYGQNKLHLML